MAALYCCAHLLASHVHLHYFVLHGPLVRIDVLCLDLCFMALPGYGFLTFACITLRCIGHTSGFRGNALHCIALLLTFAALPSLLCMHDMLNRFLGHYFAGAVSLSRAVTA
eukprot:8656445-Pyramimonas_sp.AAC.1